MFNLLLTGEHIPADIHTSRILNYHSFVVVTRGGVVVGALHYELEGRRFNSQWCHWIFSLI
jgi:hypothetical protein